LGGEHKADDFSLQKAIVVASFREAETEWSSSQEWTNFVESSEEDCG
jgi:hypothetical protein